MRETARHSIAIGGWAFILAAAAFSAVCAAGAEDFFAGGLCVVIAGLAFLGLIEEQSRAF